MFATKLQNSKKIKHHVFLKKIINISNVYIKCNHEHEKIFKERESIEILKILGLINIIEKYQKIQ